ncbi:NUDIX hydrolase [Geotalea toluenoxydans]|uniref:NUDIX hydrolase n=1 Tax=Geotalea toluenoxydans TaxID=421624 RepID=UPI001FB4430D|nr:NUDIX hydrolase [Geotalea toluenoxydans]
METENRTIVFNGIVVNIEQMEVKIGGKGWHRYQVVRHPGGVAILPLHDDGTVTLIRQLRPATGGFTLEIPAGRLCPGEEPTNCSHRELMEETGLIATNLRPLALSIPPPAFSMRLSISSLPPVCHKERHSRRTMRISKPFACPWMKPWRWH